MRRRLNNLKKRKLLLYVILALLVLVILSNVYMGINKWVTGNPVPKIMGYAPLIVISGSMEPAIKLGDVIIIKERKAKDYHVGEVVSYLDGNTVYTHRIVRMEGDQYILKGDRNNAEDDPVEKDLIVGKALFKLPYLGKLIVQFKNPVGMGVLVLMLLVLTFAGTGEKKK